MATLCTILKPENMSPYRALACAPLLITCAVWALIWDGLFGESWEENLQRRFPGKLTHVFDDIPDWQAPK